MKRKQLTVTKARVRAANKARDNHMPYVYELKKVDTGLKKLATSRSSYRDEPMPLGKHKVSGGLPTLGKRR